MRHQDGYMHTRPCIARESLGIDQGTL